MNTEENTINTIEEKPKVDQNKSIKDRIPKKSVKREKSSYIGGN